MKLRERTGWIAVVITVLAAGLMAGCFIGGRLQARPLTELPHSVAEPKPEQPAAKEQININTATAEELTGLPGIGAAKAAAIVAYREANGPFQYPEDLLQVKGIGEKILEDILDQITVGGR